MVTTDAEGHMTHILFTLSAEAVVALEAGDLELVAVVDEAIGALRRRHSKTAVTSLHFASLEGENSLQPVRENINV